MENYIIELLNSNLRVIIPDFGAFIVRQKDPRIIVFNEFLRYNDGLLIEYISKQEGIDKEIAEQRVNIYAEEAEKMLENNNVFIIKGLGKLEKDASGKINFIEEGELVPDEKITKKKVKEEPSAKKTTAKETAEKKEAEKEVKPADKTVPLKETAKPQEPAEEKKAVKPGPEVVHAVDKKPAEKTVELKQQPQEQSVQQHEPAKEQKKEDIKPEPVVEKAKISAAYSSGSSAVKQQKPAEPVITTVKSGGNKRNQVLIWIILILLVNAAILAWFVYHDDLVNLFKGKQAGVQVADTISNNEADTSNVVTSEDTSLKPEVTVPTPVANIPAKVSQPSQPRYYIVAGCFREEAHADAYVRSLKNKGYNAEKFGRIGNLYAVSFDSFTSKEQAMQELKHIREQVQAEAWMTQY